MGPHKFEAAIKASLTVMRRRLVQAASIARVAEACADAGSLEKAVEVALGFEQLIGEVSAFLNAVSLMSRLGETERTDAEVVGDRI